MFLFISYPLMMEWMFIGAVLFFFYILMCDQLSLYITFPRGSGCSLCYYKVERKLLFYACLLISLTHRRSFQAGVIFAWRISNGCSQGTWIYTYACQLWFLLRILYESSCYTIAVCVFFVKVSVILMHHDCFRGWFWKKKPLYTGFFIPVVRVGFSLSSFFFLTRTHFLSHLQSKHHLGVILGGFCYLWINQFGYIICKAICDVVCCDIFACKFC